ISAGLSRQQYRTALEKLVELEYIEIIYNGKNFLKREKSTIKVTISGMLVNLKDSSIWDINAEESNQHINQRSTNDQPTSNHKQERIRKKKKEEEEHTPPYPQTQEIPMEAKKVSGSDFSSYSFSPKMKKTEPEEEKEPIQKTFELKQKFGELEVVELTYCQ